jgi:hypothetical protein
MKTGELKLIMTSSVCPEQYDVIFKDKVVAYFRLRHGGFRVDCPTCGGETVYFAYVKGDGCFYSDRERSIQIHQAKKAVIRYYKGHPECLQ